MRKVGRKERGYLSPKLRLLRWGEGSDKGWLKERKSRRKGGKKDVERREKERGSCHQSSG